jgi:hypothetical protein
MNLQHYTVGVEYIVIEFGRRRRLMKLLTILPTALFVLLVATIAAGADKTPPTYQKGTIMGYNTRVDPWGGNGNYRRAQVYELKGTDLVYRIDYCGSFQSGKFEAGQAVDYRVDGKRLYIRRDDDKEYGCKIEGTRVLEGTKPDAPATAPAAAPATPPPAAAPPAKP